MSIFQKHEVGMQKNLLTVL